MEVTRGFQISCAISKRRHVVLKNEATFHTSHPCKIRVWVGEMS